MIQRDRMRFAINTNSITTTAAGGEPQEDKPIMRVSNDAGQTFGSVINLGTNGTITTTNTTTATAVPE